MENQRSKGKLICLDMIRICDEVISGIEMGNPLAVTRGQLLVSRAAYQGNTDSLGVMIVALRTLARLHFDEIKKGKE